MAKMMGIFSNLETKVMALIMAVVLYVYAMSEHSGQESNVSVPFNIILPPATTVLEKFPDRVLVNFSGPQKAIERLREVRNHIEVRYEAEERGHENDNEWAATVTPAANHVMGVPREISVTKIEPDTFNLTIARTTTKELKVKLQMEGEPPAGFEISKADPSWVYPGTITVTGPKRVLSRATEISTVPVKLSSLPPIADQRFRRNVPVEQFVEVKDPNQPQPRRERIDCNQSVEYWITLTQIKDTLPLKKLPVNVLMPPNFQYLARLIPGNETVDVQVKGLKPSLAKLTATNVYAYVYVGDQRPKPLPVSLPVRFVLPDEVQGKVEIVEDPPKTVGVDIVEPPQPKKEGAGAMPR